jgi:hypothetical protein
MSDRPLQSLSLRQAIIQHLRGDADLTALVPAVRIYGQRTPAQLTWPFIGYGAPSESPVRAGTQIRITMHAFSKAQFEDEASNIVAAMQKSLENAVLDVGAGLKAYLAYVGSQILADPAEADAWHGVATWNATIG